MNGKVAYANTEVKNNYEVRDFLQFIKTKYVYPILYGSLAQYVLKLGHLQILHLLCWGRSYKAALTCFAIVNATVNV